MASVLKIGDTAPDFQFDTPWEEALSFYAETEGSPTVLMFLRYMGCPICQMEMARIRQQINLFVDKGARVFVVLQSEPATVAASADRENRPFTVVCDPGGDIFRLYGVAPGGFFRYLHPSGLTAAIKATLKGYRHGKFEGHETQVPAAFVVGQDRTVIFAHYGKTVSDLPLPAEIAARF